MKKIFFLIISILIVTVVCVKAGNPIPSFNVPLTHQAYFQEDNSGIGANGEGLCKEKRDMNVSNEAGGGRTSPFGPGSATITVYIYRLDQSVILGPYEIREGKRISVPIDNNLWGVSTATDNPTYVSVWTDFNAAVDHLK